MKTAETVQMKHVLLIEDTHECEMTLIEDDVIQCLVVCEESTERVSASLF